MQKQISTKFDISINLWKKINCKITKQQYSINYDGQLKFTSYTTQCCIVTGQIVN